MGKLRKMLNALIPEYSLIPLIAAVTVNMGVYGGARMIAGDWLHHNIECGLDRMNYILIARQGKKEVCQFFAADFLSRMICLACYLIYPTTNTRPMVEAEGFWNQVVAVLYRIDAADNLFPSIHCLVSWFCYIGIRGKSYIPRWYRGASCVMALLVCISTLTTKQHVIVDVIGGVALAEICLLIGKLPAVWGKYEKVLDKFLHDKRSRKRGKLRPEGGSA